MMGLGSAIQAAGELATQSGIVNPGCVSAEPEEPKEVQGEKGEGGSHGV